MYIYNITFNLEESIEQDWQKYVKGIFIPAMLQSGLLQSALTSRIMVEEQQGISYSIQFTTKDSATLKQFIDAELYPILNKLHLKYAPKMVFFATELSVIDEQ
jgi:hypothetical protein